MLLNVPPLTILTVDFYERRRGDPRLYRKALFRLYSGSFQALLRLFYERRRGEARLWHRADKLSVVKISADVFTTLRLSQLTSLLHSGFGIALKLKATKADLKLCF